MTKFNPKYREVLIEQTAQIERDTRAGILTRPERMAIIDKVSKEYTYQHAWANEIATENERRSAEAAGRKPRELPINPPESELLDKLADLILYEELTDATPYKIANTEYPIMSANMMEERSEKDVQLVGVDYETDRKATGKRRKRTRREDYLVDKNAKARNAERRRKYHEFTKVQPVTTYNIYDK